MSHWSSVENLTMHAHRILAVLVSVPASRYRAFCYFLIAIWFLVMLSELFWKFIPVPDVHGSHAIQSTIVNSPRKNSAHEKVNVEEMQQWFLFGQAEQVIEDTAIVDVSDDVNDDAGESRLNLSLMGVIQAQDPTQGYAIIVHQSKSELYKVGDKVPGGRDVKLAKVLADRVILDNRGSYEALLLWETKALNQFSAPKKQSANNVNSAKKKVVDQRNNSNISKMASKYRKQLLTNPMSLADVIKISIAKDGQGNIMGYRIRPGRDRKQFTDFGLQSGDIITAVNGTSLDDPSQTMQLYGQMKQATQAAFDIKRGNEELTLIINLTDG